MKSRISKEDEINKQLEKNEITNKQVVRECKFSQLYS